MSAMAPSQKQGASVSPQKASRPPGESLQKVRRGEMALDAYLDEVAEQAIAHVRDSLPAEDLESLRVTIRAQLESNPNIVAMVQQLTGRAPNP